MTMMIHVLFAWKSAPMTIMLQFQVGDSWTHTAAMLQNRVDMLQAPSDTIGCPLDAILLIILEVLVEKP